MSFDTNAAISIVLENTLTQTTRSIPLLLRNNYYEVDLSGITPGDYNFTIRVENEQLSQSGSFKVLNFDIEKQFLNANVDKLAKLAENTDGEIFFPEQFSELEKVLFAKEEYTAVQKSKENEIPLIDWKYLLALIVISLSIEWFLRKYNGLI